MTLPAAAPALRDAKSERNTSGGFLPTRVIEVELTEPLPKLAHDGHYGRAWILARLYTEPIGVCVVTLPREGITPDALAAQLWTELSGPVAQRFEAAGLTGARGAGREAAWRRTRTAGRSCAIARRCSPTRLSSALSSAPATGQNR